MSQYETSSSIQSNAYETNTDEYTITLAGGDHNGDSADATPPKFKDKKERPWSKYVYFRPEWCEDPILKGWLAPDPKNEQRVFCKICRKSLAAHKKDLHHHAATRSHSTLAASYSFDDDEITDADGNVILSQNEIEQISFTRPKTRKYTKRKMKREISSSPSKAASMAQMTLEQVQSIQAVEFLLGLDLAHTLRGLGDIEINIPVDDISPSKPKMSRVSSQL